MNCKEFQNDLFDYLDDQMNGETRRAFEEHAERCQSCKATYERLKALNQAISLEKSLEPNPFIQTRILQKLEDAKAYRQVHTPIVLRPILLTLGLIVALTTGFLIGTSGSLKKSQSEMENLNIETLRSDFFVRDFADEDISLIDKE